MPTATPDSPALLARIAEALERLSPAPPRATDPASADAFVWQPGQRRLAPVTRVNRVEMTLLRGIDRVRDMLVDNTERFARGLPANNALLWGARVKRKLQRTNCKMNFKRTTAKSCRQALAFRARRSFAVCSLRFEVAAY